MTAGSRRTERVIYLGDRWPAEWDTQPWCGYCGRPLAGDPDPNGEGEMFTCYGGCGQRYWLDGC